MLRAWIGALAGAASLAMLAGPVAQAQPTSALGKWYCSVLADDFDPEAAMKAFPLEKLGPAKRTRETEDHTVHAKLVAEGDDFAVTYAYLYNEDDVDHRYGFRLTIEAGPAGELDDRDMMLWLMEFGVPEKDFSGYIVGGGPKSASGGDYRFEFGVWNSGRYYASWSGDRDIRRAANLCAGAKPVPPGAVLANDMSVGPTLDKKTDKVSLWYCSVLKAGVDPVAAIKAFPLETLPAPRETRETDDDGTSVILAAEGDDFKLEYRYIFKTDEVDEPYGFGLYVQPAHSSTDSVAEAMAWLRGFGAPTKDEMGLGYQVGAGNSGFSDDAPFKFVVWDTFGIRSAQWFLPADIKNAAKLCN